MQTMNVNIIPDKTAGVIKFSQYDVGRSVEVYLIDESGAYSIPSGATLTFHGTKPSGLGFTVSTTNEGTYTTITSTAEMTDEAGRFPVELVITNGDTVIGTANFTMWVERSPHPEGTTDGQAEVIVPVLTALIERAETAAESAIDSAAEAKRQADRAFSGTPEGYDALVQSVTDEFNIYGAKNLLQSNGLTTSSGGVTYTAQDDGTVALSGTGTATASQNFGKTSFALPAGTYILTGAIASPRAYVNLSKVNYSGSGANVIGSDTGNGFIFTLDEPTVLYSRVYTYGNNNYDGVVVKPMLRAASISDSEYVPYAMTNRELTEVATWEDITSELTNFSQYITDTSTFVALYNRVLKEVKIHGYFVVTDLPTEITTMFNYPAKYRPRTNRYVAGSVYSSTAVAGAFYVTTFLSDGVQFRNVSGATHSGSIGFSLSWITA